MKCISRLVFTCCIWTCQCAAEIIVSPRATVVEREGITGGGQLTCSAGRTFLIYPNHPDDFGGTGGTGASVSTDGGTRWTAMADNWPMANMVDLWIDPLKDGTLIAFGIHWVPDPKKRGEQTVKDVPANAYAVAISTDNGVTWRQSNATIDCPAELGIIARPLPHIIETKDGALLMPAYSWGKTGNRSLLLQSTNRGRHWTTRSIITSAADMVKAGATITTPWLETTVAITKDGSCLAIVRTGSSAASALMSARSTDQGKTWEKPSKLPIAGKLPTLQFLPNGVLALLTAHSKNHCRIYTSDDGTGRTWSDARIISSQCGGNAGMAIAGTDTLLITTPANRRIDSWGVSIKPAAAVAADLAPPINVTLAKGILTWKPTTDAVAYRVTPILIKTPPGYTDTQIYPHATIQTQDATPSLDLSRQLLVGANYAFTLSAMDAQNRTSSKTTSPEMKNVP